jgi:hypothetical protein
MEWLISSNPTCRLMILMIVQRTFAKNFHVLSTESLSLDTSNDSHKNDLDNTIILARHPDNGRPRALFYNGRAQDRNQKKYH